MAARLRPSPAGTGTVRLRPAGLPGVEGSGTVCLEYLDMTPGRGQLPQLSDVSWEGVRAFSKVWYVCSERTEYQSLLGRARKAFHPDRWAGRRILKSVRDDQMRADIEAAGKLVSQELNALWEQYLQWK